MKSKLNLTLGLLVILAASYTFVFEYQKPQKEKEKKEQDSKLLTLKVDQINAVEIHRNGAKTRLEKKETGWYLVEPFQDEADTSLVQDLVDSLGREVYFDFVSETAAAPLDVKTFGFDTPMARITFTDNAGEKNSFSLSSKKNFEGHSLLQREGDARVFIVNTVWQSLLMRSDEELRNRQLFRGKVAGINELELRNQKGLLNLRLDGTNWSSNGQNKITIDQNKVREILSTLAESKFSKWLKAGPRGSAGSEDWGLLRPRVELRVQSSEKAYDLIFGKGKDQVTYVYLSQTQAFAEVPLHIFEKFESYGMDFVRDKKRAFDFDSTRVGKIIYKGNIKSFEKNKAEGEFSNFLKIFKDSEALRFEPKCKLRKVVHSFDFQSESHESIYRLDLGETIDEKDQKFICSRSSMEEEMFVVPEGFLKNLQEHRFFSGNVSEKESKQ